MFPCFPFSATILTTLCKIVALLVGQNTIILSSMIRISSGAFRQLFEKEPFCGSAYLLSLVRFVANGSSMFWQPGDC